MSEEWRVVEGFPDYEVSNLGRIRRRTDTTNKKRGDILSQWQRETGYTGIHLRRDDDTHNLYPHRIVAEAFIPNPEGKPCVNHKDGNKSNNRASNLEWCTYKENTQHARDNGLLNDCFGADNGMAKLCANDVREIRNLSGEIPQYEIADMFGISTAQTSRIINRQRWSHI